MVWKNLILMIFFFCSCGIESGEKSAYAEKNIFSWQNAENIRNNKDPLYPGKRGTTGSDIKLYLEYYKLPLKMKDYNFGYTVSGKYDIFVQIFGKGKSKGTVFLIHGYLDHSGLNSRLIKFIMERGYRVVVFDLPGHGLSTGKAADISSFRDYGQVLRHIVNKFTGRPGERRIIMGHSTGCSAAIEYAYSSGDRKSKYIFIAPLVRSHMWHASRLGMKLIRPFAKQIFRRSGGSTSDMAYYSFLKSDPMRLKYVPFHWTDRLADWNVKVKSYGKLKLDLVIFQGAEDTVVDWRYNIDFLKDKFPGTRAVMIGGGKHCLQYEEKKIRERFYSSLKKHL